jgi:hypothetical protein
MRMRMTVKTKAIRIKNWVGGKREKDFCLWRWKVRWRKIMVESNTTSKE